MKLIALAIIAAGLAAANSPELAVDTVFDADPAYADKLIADGLAKESATDPAPAAPAKKDKPIKARLLVDSPYGKANEVVSLPASEAKHAQTDGLLDTAPAAVAYAESLVA